MLEVKEEEAITVLKAMNEMNLRAIQIMSDELKRAEEVLKFYAETMDWPVGTNVGGMARSYFAEKDKK